MDKQDGLERSLRRAELLVEGEGVRASIAVIQAGAFNAPVTAAQAAQVEQLKSRLADLEKQIAELGVPEGFDRNRLS